MSARYRCWPTGGRARPPHVELEADSALAAACAYAPRSLGGIGPWFVTVGELQNMLVVHATRTRVERKPDGTYSAERTDY